MKRNYVPFFVSLGIISFAVLTWTALVTLIPRSSRADEPTKVYFADNISPFHREAISEFNRRHQGHIEVVPVDLPFDKFSTNERKELLARSLRSRSEKVDVFAVDLIWVPRFARWSEPLDGYFTQGEKNRLLSYAMQSCVYDRQLVAMPMYIDVGLMYYRKDIVRRLPDGANVERRLQESITWDQVEDLRRRLGYENRPFYVFQAKDYEGLVCNLLEVAVGRDHRFLSDGRMNITSAPVEQALTMLVDLVRRNVSPKAVIEFDENASYRYALDHDAVFVRGWPNFVENFSRFYPDSTKLMNIGRAPLPHFPGEPATSVFGGWDLMVSKASTKKAAAVEFIRFLETEEIQRFMFVQGGYIPVVNSIYGDSGQSKPNSDLAFYGRLLSRGFHRPALVEYTQSSDIISHFAHLAIAQDLSVLEALGKAEAMIHSNEVIVK